MALAGAAEVLVLKMSLFFFFVLLKKSPVICWAHNSKFVPFVDNDPPLGSLDFQSRKNGWIYVYRVIVLLFENAPPT